MNAGTMGIDKNEIADQLFRQGSFAFFDRTRACPWLVCISTKGCQDRNEGLDKQETLEALAVHSWINAAKGLLNPLNPELNPICYLLALLAHHFLHVSRIRVKSLTLRLLMSYIYGAPIRDVSRSHTTTQHSR